MTGASVRSGLSAGELGEICEPIVAGLGVAGAQIAVLQGDELAQAPIGIANRELDIAVRDDTVFQIGSTTKLWNAVLVMQLVDDGLLELDVPVTGYLPDVRLASEGNWRAITLRHLLSMSSGLDNGPYTDTGRDDGALARYVGLLGDVPLIFEPGTAYGYSNASSNLAGLVAQTVTGIHWDDLLQDRVLDRGGFREAVSLFDRLPYFRVAVGQHVGERRAHRPWHMGRGQLPAGSTLATSARDLARLARMISRGGVADDGARILSSASAALMQTPQVSVPPKGFADDWCLGPFRRDWNGLDVFGHPGTTESGASMVVWIPELDLVLALAHNTPWRGSRLTAEVFEAVLRDRLGVPVPRAPDPAGVGAVDPAPYLGRYASSGRDFEVTVEDGELVLTAHSERYGSAGGGDDPAPVRSVIRSVGPHRFHAENDAVTWSYGWELAFTVGDDGRATLFHNGAMASRRVG